ncbi:hypothetical protein C8R45DRAFT_974225 [Mycena sanguinolenta]|nr:hypothetical protein C8R45DRAFT_974225 [Mycena sanguinolenta]
MNACPVVSVERDDRSAARRLRLVHAPHGRCRYSPRPRLRLLMRFTSVGRLQPSFPSACFTWASLRVILLVFGGFQSKAAQELLRGCFQFDGLRLCGRAIPACTLLGPVVARLHPTFIAIQSILVFLSWTRPRPPPSSFLRIADPAATQSFPRPSS